MRGNKQTDSGNYVNGIYTTKNGFNNSGLGCPKGTRLYNPEVIQPLIFFPEDNAPGENWQSISQDIAPDILPYYAISNYGRVMNTRSGKVMKENFRPNGYGYYCLAAENCKYGQKKYSTHRLVMMTFKPVDNMEQLDINHKNGIKSENYIDKVFEDGSISSNLEWVTKKENATHRSRELKSESNKINFDIAKNIRELRNKNYLSYKEISDNYYPDLSVATIQNVCTNKIYTDSEYEPIDPKYFYNKQISKSSYLKITDDDAKKIRELNIRGINAKDIQKEYYPDVSYSTILDIVNNKSHNR